MNKKLAKLFIAASIVIGGLELATSNSAHAHYDEHDLRHGHVCTESTSLNVRTTPNVDRYGTPTGDIMLAVSKGERLQVKASYYNWELDTTWYEIRLGDSEMLGFVYGKYVCF